MSPNLTQVSENLKAMFLMAIIETPNLSSRESFAVNMIIIMSCIVCLFAQSIHSHPNPNSYRLQFNFDPSWL